MFFLFPRERERKNKNSLVSSLSFPSLPPLENKTQQIQNNAPPAVCHQVDPLGRVLRKDNLPVAARVDELRHFGPRRFITRRRPRRELVDAAVHVRVVPRVVVVHRLEDRQRLLGGRAVVEVDEPSPPFESLVEDREVGADAGGEERGGGGGR